MSRRNQLTLGREDDNKFIPSTSPSTNFDVQQLAERFDLLLAKEEALEAGFCPTRRRLYNDLFSELIRITKVHCDERGILLERVQNEFLQWMRTYENLYSSAMAYSFRQYLNRLEEQKDLQFIINELENDCQQLCDQLNQEKQRLAQLEERVEEKRRSGDQKMIELRKDLRAVRAINKKLKTDLDTTLSGMLSSQIFLGQSIDDETTIS